MLSRCSPPRACQCCQYADASCRAIDVILSRRGAGAHARLYRATLPPLAPAAATPPPSLIYGAIVVAIARHSPADAAPLHARKRRRCMVCRWFTFRRCRKIRRWRATLLLTTRFHFDFFAVFCLRPRARYILMLSARYAIADIRSLFISSA